MERALALPSAGDIARLPPGIWTFRGQAHAVAAREPPIADPPIKLILQLEGGAEVRQCGRRTSLGPGQFTLIDAAKPCSAVMDAPFAQALVIFPRAAVLRRHRRIDACLALPFGEDGAHAIVRDFTLSLAAHAPALPSATLSRAIAALIELIADLGGGEARDAHSTLLHRALALIDLEVADLDAARLARRLGVSRRYLDKLFGRSGRTVSQHLWDRRLGLAAERRGRPKAACITEIAYSVGFKDASHFTRAFKTRFGATPSEWRRARGSS